jgi:hypothetical protein
LPFATTATIVAAARPLRLSGQEEDAKGRSRMISFCQLVCLVLPSRGTWFNLVPPPARGAGSILCHSCRGLVCATAAVGSFVPQLPWARLCHNCRGLFCAKTAMGSFVPQLPWALLCHNCRRLFCAKTAVGSFVPKLLWAPWPGSKEPMTLGWLTTRLQYRTTDRFHVVHKVVHHTDFVPRGPVWAQGTKLASK